MHRKCRCCLKRTTNEHCTASRQSFPLTPPSSIFMDTDASTHPDLVLAPGRSCQENTLLRPSNPHLADTPYLMKSMTSM